MRIRFLRGRFGFVILIFLAPPGVPGFLSCFFPSPYRGCPILCVPETSVE